LYRLYRKPPVTLQPLGRGCYGLGKHENPTSPRPEVGFFRFGGEELDPALRIAELGGKQMKNKTVRVIDS
jgi:hypothetical protein